MNDRDVFIGRYDRRIQKDCRLGIPKEFRDTFSRELQNPKHRLVLQRGDHGVELCIASAIIARHERCGCLCLLCLVPEMTAWGNPDYCMWAVSFDRQGRLRIPAAALELIRAKPGETIILAGLIDTVEIVSERVWKKSHAAHNPTQVSQMQKCVSPIEPRMNELQLQRRSER